MGTNSLLLALSLFIGIILLILFWPYILILMGILTMAVCAVIVLIAVVIAIFVIFQFLLIPYYAIKRKEYVEIGSYSIKDAKEPGEMDDRDKEI